MNIPQLPEVEKVSDLIANEIRKRKAGPGAVFQVLGPPTSGKSALLVLLKERLEKEGITAIKVAPPPHAPDAGPSALVEVGTGLKEAGLIDGKITRLLEPGRSYSEKVRDIRTWLDEGSQKCKLVLLCDEPSSWEVRSREDEYFSVHAGEAVGMLCGPARCTRVVSGALPKGVIPSKVISLKLSTWTKSWLNDGRAWGSLEAPAASLLSYYGDRMDRFSPLQVRLLVGLAELISVRDVGDLIDNRGSRRDISRRFAGALSRRPSLEALRSIWSSLALVRRPFPEDLLAEMGGDRLEETDLDLLEKCLLYEEAGGFKMHEMLKADIRDVPGCGSRDEVLDTHRKLVDWYETESSRGTGAGGLVDEMEAFHHATMTGDCKCTDRLKPFFIDQLNVLGRELSRTFRNYEEAAKVFEKALRCDPEDDYAHHYLAFNLDVMASDPARVEKHFMKAIELNPDHAWWHSRMISFLVTRGRAVEARRAWDEALDALGLPDAGGDQYVYENLHLWVAHLLIHRGRIDFAQEVLDGIPKELIANHEGFGAVKRRMEALLEARRRGAYVPVRYLGKDWWKKGPFLLHERIPGGSSLKRWFAGCIEEVSEEAVFLRVASVETGGDQAPESGRLSVSIEDLNRWGAMIDYSELGAGTFLEIGEYRGEGNEMKLALVHRPLAWLDENLPPLFPDPARYLKKGFSGT
jgi:tetratricopeptide (TPR) repeat protein